MEVTFLFSTQKTLDNFKNFSMQIAQLPKMMVSSSNQFKYFYVYFKLFPCEFLIFLDCFRLRV